MKKHTEKPPIDDLFARKLGNMSLPPSPDGFERLQARMGRHQSEPKIVFWRNPAIYGYTAAAACLLLVCLFGWLYWPSNKQTTLGASQIAVNGGATKQSRRDSQLKTTEQLDAKTAEVPTQSFTSPMPTRNDEQLAGLEKSPSLNKVKNQLTDQSTESKRVTVTKASSMPKDRPILAQAKPSETKSNAEADVVTALKTADVSVSEQSAVVAAKPTPAPERERVLEVTIAEPETLVAARQAAKASIEEKPVVAATSKPEKEAKESLWHQLKQLKQGEVVARGNEDNDNEHSLIGRAYTGLKQSLGKDKSAKQ